MLRKLGWDIYIYRKGVSEGLIYILTNKEYTTHIFLGLIILFSYKILLQNYGTHEVLYF